MKVFEDKGEWVRLMLVVLVAIAAGVATHSFPVAAILFGIGLWMDYVARLVIIGAASKREASLTSTLESVRSVLESERGLSASRFDLITDLKRDVYNAQTAKMHAENRLATRDAELSFERTKFAEFQRSILNSKMEPIEKFVIDSAGKKYSLTGSGRRRR